MGAEMSSGKKQRLSILDGLGQTAALAPAPVVQNRALRAAQDAVDGHRIWELDPDQIVDLRVADRLDEQDVDDLRRSIETLGQTVPILVRRDPEDSERFRLVYGRRRLEAVRSSKRVVTVRAMIAALDDRAALEAQASENAARRDLSFIERALFALELTEGGFGNQTEIADMLNTTRSAISMSISIARALGRDLVHAIGPAYGIGRPRWERAVQMLQVAAISGDELCEVARTARENANADAGDPSVVAFEAVFRRLHQETAAKTTREQGASRPVRLQGEPAGRAIRTKEGLRLELRINESGFADWLHQQVDLALEELHERWKTAGGG